MSAAILIQYPGTDLHLGLRLSAGHKQLPKYFEVVYKGDRIGILGRPKRLLEPIAHARVGENPRNSGIAAASLISGSCLDTERFLSPCTECCSEKDRRRASFADDLD